MFQRVSIVVEMEPVLVRRVQGLDLPDQGFGTASTSAGFYTRGCEYWEPSMAAATSQEFTRETAEYLNSSLIHARLDNKTKIPYRNPQSCLLLPKDTTVCGYHGVSCTKRGPVCPELLAIVLKRCIIR
jgi:hypothetical protein